MMGHRNSNVMKACNEIFFQATIGANMRLGSFTLSILC